MKATKVGTSVTLNFTIEEGPIAGTNPQRLSQGKFQVEKLSLTYHEGAINRAFIRGRNVLPSGEYGRIYHDRTLLPSEFPEWLVKFIDEQDQYMEDRIIGEIKHNISPVIGWLRRDAQVGKVDTDGVRLKEWRGAADNAGKVIAAMLRGK